jgi:hypothetical protein
MANISIKLNLQQLKHVSREMKGKDGKMIKVIILPVEENQLFEGEKGTYLDITAIQIKNKVGDSKDTHLLKQSFSKEVYDKMSDEEKKAYPILGNAILWGKSEPNPVASEQFPDDANEEEDDLPFS